MAPEASKSTRVGWVLLGVIAVVGIGIRVWDFPGRYEIRDVDELPYLQGSLALLEGLTPALKYAPAGPQTWLGWGYAGWHAVEHLVRPGPEERRAPLQLRPFVAVDHALFDLYRDYSGLKDFLLYVAVALSVGAIVAGFGLGRELGGLPGAVLMGGVLAAGPMFVRFTNMPRPFSTGWSFAVMSLYYAWASRSRRRWALSIGLMGLAIGSRIDLLLLLPVWWSALWKARRVERVSSGVVVEGSDPNLRNAAPVGKLAPSLFAATCAVIAVTLLVAPWLLTNLIGNLRTIFTVRFSPPPGGSPPVGRTILGLTWHEGLGVLLPLFAAGLVQWPGRWMVKIYALLLALTMLKATAQGFHHQGAPILVLLFFAAVGAGSLYLRWPRVAWGIIAAALLLPLGQGVRAVIAERRNYVPDEAVEWVTAHVPAGTIVYTTPGMHNLLPTPQASAALWAEVTDDSAWRKKFGTGLTRFGLSMEQLPRSLSEEHMVHERAFRRGWFITGGRTDLPDPRFDVRLYRASAVFGIQDPVPEFNKTGGVLIWRGTALDALATPAAKWTDAEGRGTYVYLKGVSVRD